MNFHILTLFPEMVENGLKTSIIGRAVAGGLLSIEAVNIRDFAFNKHQSVDDYPYGGGAGMLMQAEPVYLAYKDIEERIQKRIQNAKMQNAETEEQDAEVKVQNAGIQDAETVSPDKKLRVVYLSPQGKTFDQKMAEELAEEEDLVLLCGHYEGIDERVLEEIVTDYVSIGDYVLTGGELPAMVMVDTISRLVPGVLHNDVSAEFESFQDNLLEYPQYSRPEEWHGKKVPPVLLSGHHANIEKWRREQSILRTYERRPDLLEKSSLTWKEKKWLEEVKNQHMKGLVLVPVRSENKELRSILQELEANGTAVVLTEKDVKNAGMDGVFADEFRGAYEGICRLIEKGCKRIGIAVGQMENDAATEERYRGCVQALEDNGIALPEELILREVEDINRVLQGKKLPDALFALNETAVGQCFKELFKGKKQGTEKILFMGMDAEKTAKLLEDEMLSVERDGRKQGKEAVKLLLEAFDTEENDRIRGKRVMIPYKVTESGAC